MQRDRLLFVLDRHAGECQLLGMRQQGQASDIKATCDEIAENRIVGPLRAVTAHDRPWLKTQSMPHVIDFSPGDDSHTKARGECGKHRGGIRGNARPLRTRDQRGQRPVEVEDE